MPSFWNNTHGSQNLAFGVLKQVFPTMKGSASTDESQSVSAISLILLDITQTSNWCSVVLPCVLVAEANYLHSLVRQLAASDGEQCSVGRCVEVYLRRSQLSS